MINGERTEFISVRDRGLQYGDGCFETLRLINHTPVLLEQHLHRLQRTCQVLQLEIDLTLLRHELSDFIDGCQPEGVIKIVLTRGVGGRGYSPAKPLQTSRILHWSSIPDEYAAKSGSGVTIGVSSYRLSDNPALAGLKHLNRLDQVMASFSLSDELDEALCLDQTGHVIEATKSNLVIVDSHQLVTPCLDRAGVRGVMLEYLREQFADSGTAVESRRVTLADVQTASELFLCNSVFGVWPVRKYVENAKVCTWPVGPWTKQALRYQHEIFDPAR